MLETEAPSFSGDLSNPGLLESLLIATTADRLGVGRHPNAGRSPIDVAALLISVATYARSNQAELTADDLVSKIGLRTDHGAIAQQFPFDEASNVSKESWLQELTASVESERVTLVTGAPGIGKSWLLCEFAQRMRSRGHLVARHFCYLEPGDADAGARIRSERMFGNLIEEILEYRPDLRHEVHAPFASDRTALEQLLQASARRPGESQISVIIVDGLDHIGRVEAELPGSLRASTDIVDELSAMCLGAGVRLVVGSQPGEHLESLVGGAKLVELGAWTDDEVGDLAIRLQLPRLCASAGTSLEPLLGDLKHRASGSPLYATFLVRGIAAVIESGELQPREWLDSSPTLSGDIAQYYEYLYSSSPKEHRAIADVLGVIDFPITQQDLSEIVPLLAPSVAPAVAKLRPVLVEIRGQGGLRVFHESFRRFVRERPVHLGADPAQANNWVARWLGSKGLFRESRSYGHLLQVLRRCGETDELFALVGPSFISQSVSWGHPVAQVRRNLGIALEVAASEQRWDAISALAELYRSLHSFSQENQNWALYWQAIGEVRGWTLLSERLLHDGRPAVSVELGLSLCSQIDDAGEVAPWREYLAALKASGGVSDPDALTSWFHGECSLGGPSGAEQWLARVVAKYRDELTEAEVAGLARRATRVSPGISQRCLSDNVTLSPRIRSVAAMAEAKALIELGRPAAARWRSEIAVELDASRGAAALAVRLGATRVLPSASDPRSSSITIGLDGRTTVVDRDRVEEWMRAVAVEAAVAPDRLIATEASIQGAGFYRGWLRYVLLMSRAEAIAARRPGEGAAMAVAAFRELASDVRPFEGRPRSCDLGRIRPIIAESIGRGLALLVDVRDWSTATGLLETVVDGTNTTLQGSQSGPVLHETAIWLIAEHAPDGVRIDSVADAVERLAADAAGRGQYFSDLAESASQAALAIARLGSPQRALTHWERAAQLMSAYGHRKDSTVYEVLSSVGLLRDSPDWVVEQLGELQQDVVAVSAHTDGRGTGRVQVDWIRELARVAPKSALKLIGDSHSAGFGRFGWTLEEGLQVILREVRGDCSPALLVLLWQTLPFLADHAEAAKRDAAERLAAIAAVPASRSEFREGAYRRLTAQVLGDGAKAFRGAIDSIEPSSAQFGLRFASVPLPSEIEPDAKPWEDRERARADSIGWSPPLAPPAALATPLELMAWVDSALHAAPPGLPNGWRGRVLNAVGYGALAMAQGGDELGALRVVRHLAQRLPRYERSAKELLRQIGRGFGRHGRPRLGSATLALAYTSSRGGGGWDAIGGTEEFPWLVEATELDSATAQRAFAQGAAEAMRSTSYATGFTSAIVSALLEWGRNEDARAAWSAAHAVVRHRLPSRSGRHTELEPLAATDGELDSVDAALAYALCCRAYHPEYCRRATTLWAINRAAHFAPRALAAAARHLLARTKGGVTRMAILQALLVDPPRAALSEMRSLLTDLNGSELWGERATTRALLASLGETVEGRRAPQPLSARACAPENVGEWESLDWGERVDRLEYYHPPLRSELDSDFESEYLHSQHAQEADRRRAAYARDSQRSSRFWTRVTPVASDVFEEVLHRRVGQVEAAAWARGLAGARYPDRLRNVLMPRVDLLAGAQAGRQPRPALPFPHEVASGVLPLAPDPLHASHEGWLRLGWVERAFEWADDHRWGDPASVTTVVAAARDPRRARGAAVPPTYSVPPGAPPEVETPDSCGWLAARVRHSDFLGMVEFVAPTSELISRLGVVRLATLGDLSWGHPSRLPALVIRTWRAGSIGGESSEQTARLVGAELLASPDAASVLLANQPSPPQIHLEVKTQSL